MGEGERVRRRGVRTGRVRRFWEGAPRTATATAFRGSALVTLPLTGGTGRCSGGLGSHQQWDGWLGRCLGPGDVELNETKLFSLRAGL